jgi:hypothetical protein
LHRLRLSNDLTLPVDAITVPTGDDLQGYWIRKLGKAESAFLAVILGSRTHGLPRDEVADRASYSVTSRHVDNTLGVLRRTGLIERGSPIRAVPCLFE